MQLEQLEPQLSTFPSERVSRDVLVLQFSNAARVFGPAQYEDA